MAELTAKGVKRDTTPPFGDAGYQDKNGGWVVIHEWYTWQDSEHLIEDCKINECHQIEKIIKTISKAVRSKQTGPKMG